MEVLSGHSFKSKKPSAYKIKKKQSASDVENISNLEKPRKTQNSSASAINSKRPAPQQILEDLIEISPPKNFDNKENLASLLKNHRKKLQVSKDQFIKPPEPSLTQILTPNTKSLNPKPIVIIPDETPSKKIIKIEQPKVLPKPQPPQEIKMNIENKKDIIFPMQKIQPPKINHTAPPSNIFFKNRETAVLPTPQTLPTFQSEREGLMLNFESFKRNKLRYLPHLQLKDIQFGNHLLPVLPSFLMGGN